MASHAAPGPERLSCVSEDLAKGIIAACDKISKLPVRCLDGALVRRSGSQGKPASLWFPPAHFITGGKWTPGDLSPISKSMRFETAAEEPGGPVSKRAKDYSTDACWSQGLDTHVCDERGELEARVMKAVTGTTKEEFTGWLVEAMSVTSGEGGVEEEVAVVYGICAMRVWLIAHGRWMVATRTDGYVPVYAMRVNTMDLVVKKNAHLAKKTSRAANDDRSSTEFPSAEQGRSRSPEDSSMEVEPDEGGEPEDYGYESDRDSDDEAERVAQESFSPTSVLAYARELTLTDFAVDVCRMAGLSRRSLCSVADRLGNNFWACLASRGFHDMPIDQLYAGRTDVVTRIRKWRSQATFGVRTKQPAKASSACTAVSGLAANVIVLIHLWLKPHRFLLDLRMLRQAGSAFERAQHVLFQLQFLQSKSLSSKLSRRLLGHVTTSSSSSSSVPAYVPSEIKAVPMQRLDDWGFIHLLPMYAHILTPYEFKHSFFCVMGKILYRAPPLEQLLWANYTHTLSKLPLPTVPCATVVPEPLLLQMVKMDYSTITAVAATEYARATLPCFCSKLICMHTNLRAAMVLNEARVRDTCDKRMRIYEVVTAAAASFSQPVLSKVLCALPLPHDVAAKDTNSIEAQITRRLQHLPWEDEYINHRLRVGLRLDSDAKVPVERRYQAGAPATLADLTLSAQPVQAKHEGSVAATGALVVANLKSPRKARVYALCYLKACLSSGKVLRASDLYNYIMHRFSLVGAFHSHLQRNTDGGPCLGLEALAARVLSVREAEIRAITKYIMMFYRAGQSQVHEAISPVATQRMDARGNLVDSFRVMTGTWCAMKLATESSSCVTSFVDAAEDSMDKLYRDLVAASGSDINMKLVDSSSSNRFKFLLKAMVMGTSVFANDIHKRIQT